MTSASDALLTMPRCNVTSCPTRAQAHHERRLAQQDAKRQKLRQDLERKEREGQAARSEEEQARARLKVGAESRHRATEWGEVVRRATGVCNSVGAKPMAQHGIVKLPPSRVLQLLT